MAKEQRALKPVAACQWFKSPRSARKASYGVGVFGSQFEAADPRDRGELCRRSALKGK